MTAIKNNICVDQYYPMVGAVDVLSYDASSAFVTDGLHSEGNAIMLHSGEWQVQASLLGSNADALLTIQQSADGNNWDNVVDGANIVIPSGGSVTFEDVVFTGVYIRFVYDNDTNTSGNVTLILTQK